MQFTITHQPQKRASVTGDSLASLRALLVATYDIDNVQVQVKSKDRGERR